MKFRSILFLLFCFLPIAAHAAGGGGRKAKQGDKVVVKIATVIANTNPTVDAFRRFEQAVEEKSNGQIDVQIFADAQLGDSDEAMDQLRRGDIQMSTVNPLTLNTTVTELATLDSYFMFDNVEHAYRTLDGPGGEFLLDALARMNFEGIGYLTLGFRQFSNSKRPVNTLEDLNGLKIRGYNPIQISAWESVGCVLSTVAWSELFTSLQQKLIDGQECANVSFDSAKFYEAQNYLSLTNHIYSTDIWLANKDFMDGIPAEMATLLRDEAAMAIAWQRKTVDEGDAQLLKKLNEENGVEINEVPQETKDQMREMMNAAIQDKIIEAAGQEAYDKMMGFVEAAR